MLRNITLMVAGCLIAGSPLLAQEKTAPKKDPLPPPVVHQKEVTAADIKKANHKSSEVSNPKGKMVKFKPPVVVKEEHKGDEVPLPPPPPPAPPVVKKDAKVPPPPPPAPPKKKD